LGPHQIAYALERGHTISTFTRGKTEPTVHESIFDNVEQLIGDRENDLTALEGRKWDAVIDNSGRKVEWTKKTAELLKENVGLYLYTSSTGVYYPYLSDNCKEDQQVLLTEPEGIEDEEMKLEYWYGVMKSNSEIEARKAFGDDRTIVVRPTYMVGPADRTNRFIYWPVRLSKGGKTLVPGKENDPVQYIDVRDVAEWMIRLIEEKNTGTYNAVGPRMPQSMYEFVNEAKTAFDVETEIVKVDDYDFLIQHKVPYLIPWIMPVDNNYGSARINNGLALSNGLKLRPLDDTMQEMLAWWQSDALTQEQRDKFEKDPEGVLIREESILEQWENQLTSSN
jgi:2'-hydroxyisoflavone reductase